MKNLDFISKDDIVIDVPNSWNNNQRTSSFKKDKNPFQDSLSADSKFVNIEGIEIHYQEFGDKNNPPMVLIHGYSTSTYTWNSTASLLAKSGFYVMALDLVGFGLSGKPRHFDYTIDSQAIIVLGLIDFLNIEKAIFVGSSYGGAVASVIALDEPQRVEKLILVSTVCNDEIIKDFFVGLLTRPGWGEVISPLLIKSKTFFRLRLRTTFAAKSYHLIDNEYIDAIQTPLVTDDAQFAILASLRNWEANRIEENANQIKQPTLLIWGDKDKIIKPNTGKRLNELLSNSQLSIFEQCGHAPHEEYPEKFVELVKKFCQSKLSAYNQKDSGKQTKLRKTKQFYDDIAPVHNLFFKINGYSRSIEKYLRKISIKLPAEIIFLDAGCGGGMMTSALYRAGIEPKVSVALDLSIESLVFAQEEFTKDKKVDEESINLIKGNILKLPFADESFSVVGTCGVLEYVDLKEGIAELTRILKPGGFIVFVPVRPSLLGKVLEKLYHFKTIYPQSFNHIIDKDFKVIDEYKFPITEPTGWSKKLFLLQKK